MRQATALVLFMLGSVVIALFAPGLAIALALLAFAAAGFVLGRRPAEGGNGAQPLGPRLGRRR
jgi:hypothetical protein